MDTTQDSWNATGDATIIRNTLFNSFSLLNYPQSYSAVLLVYMPQCRTAMNFDKEKQSHPFAYAVVVPMI
jgi:hypothetical protein